MLPLDRQNALRERYRLANPDWRPATEVYADLVRTYLCSDSRVLDLGCGRGGLVEQLNHPRDRIVGVDPDLASLQAHRSQLARVVAFSEHLPFRRNSFDLIFASWLLEHLEQPHLTFRAIGELLKPGAAFVFITPNGRHPLTLFNQALGRYARLQGYLVRRIYGRVEADTYPTYYRANTSATLHRFSQENGLSLTLLKTISDPTYLAFSPALFRFMCWLDARLPSDRRLHLVGVLTAQTAA